MVLRYRKPLLNLPPCCACCDRCCAPSSLDHALCCRKGGLIIQRHNEICGSIDDLATLVSDWVLSEPVVKDASENSDARIGDLGIKGVWQSQSMTLCDICVVDTDVISVTLLLLCWLQLKLKRNGSIVLLLLVIVLPSHLYVFWLMD